VEVEEAAQLGDRLRVVVDPQVSMARSEPS